MTDNTADRKDIRRREKAARITERQREDVTRELMSTTAGREFVWNILSECSIFSSTFTGDALTTAFNEGRRSIGLAWMATILQACPDQYIQAQRESNERNAVNERRSSPKPDGRDTGPDTASVQFDPDPDLGLEGNDGVPDDPASFH